MNTTTDAGQALAALTGLGFTEIEALVYVYLLQNEPSTGYRISHAVGKPTANTYKAVASLEQRGAVQVDEGDNRLVRAVPPEELLAVLERAARERDATAREALSGLSRDSADDRVYSLRDREQVLERARAMLQRAEGWVLGDIFPGPLAELAEDLTAAAGRGARVILKAYDDAELPGCRVLPTPAAAMPAATWPGQQLSLVVDADEHLLALFDQSMLQVHQAVWSRSSFLSCLQHNHLAMELTVTAYRSERLKSAAAADRTLLDLTDITLLNSGAGGLRRLQSRFGAAAIRPDHPEGNHR